MTSSRTLKVSDLTYERVHSLKRGNETVDDVLRRVLELETDSYDIENDL
jgi:predicted CopG family antitoxin